VQYLPRIFQDERVLKANSKQIPEAQEIAVRLRSSSGNIIHPTATVAVQLMRRLNGRRDTGTAAGAFARKQWVSLHHLQLFRTA
jgi:hypothetical protein